MGVFSCFYFLHQYTPHWCFCNFRNVEETISQCRFTQNLRDSRCQMWLQSKKYKKRIKIKGKTTRFITQLESNSVHHDPYVKVAAVIKQTFWQHSGIILIILAISDPLPFRVVWCEVSKCVFTITNKPSNIFKRRKWWSCVRDGNISFVKTTGNLPFSLV